ncbi:hypothetical protein [Bosea lathyri]|nr:hypothetical protein [Bosea lathyri]
MGSYAQIARELSEGGSPADFIGYGPLWHFFGAWIFKLAGVNFSALLIAFHFLIIICSVLLAMALRQATGTLWPGLVAAAAIILVPPFLASTMRLVCLALIAWPFVALARTEPQRDRAVVMTTAAVIAVIMMIRPDFAYLYAAALGTILIGRTLLLSGDFREKLAYLLRRTLYASIAFVVVMAPLALHAVIRGYGWHLLLEIVRYPTRILFFLGMRLGETSELGSASGSLLKMPPVSAIFDLSSGQQIFALLIYSTLAGLVGAFIALVWRALRNRDDARIDQPLFAIFLLAACQWPIFGLFRPSWVHFVGFMHCYVLLALALVVWLNEPWRSARRLDQPAARAIQVLLLAQVALFVGYGALFGETGLGMKLSGRDAVFEGKNGVRVRVSAGEKRIYDNVAAIIEQNSSPGDRIVCVPYCAGFPFMTDRQPLFREHYVDDATPLVYPGWLDKAIALTDAAKPPVIIVLDWAPNDTHTSRFDVWARRYIDHINATYPISGRFEMGRVWLRDGAMRPPPTRVPVLDYGPRSARVGVPFNQQPNGQSALWIKLDRNIGGGAVVRLDGRDLPAVVTDGGVSALVPADALKQPGQHELKVVNTLRNAESDPVTLVLDP